MLEDKVKRVIFLLVVTTVYVVTAILVKHLDSEVWLSALGAVMGSILFYSFAIVWVASGLSGIGWMMDRMPGGR